MLATAKKSCSETCNFSSTDSPVMSPEIPKYSSKDKFPSNPAIDSSGDISMFSDSNVCRFVTGSSSLNFMKIFAEITHPTSKTGARVGRMSAHSISKLIAILQANDNRKLVYVLFGIRFFCALFFIIFQKYTNMNEYM